MIDFAIDLLIDLWIDVVINHLFDFYSPKIAFYKLISKSEFCRIWRSIVVPTDIEEWLKHPMRAVRAAIFETKCGQQNITKDFLEAGVNSTKVTKDQNSKRRKCIGFYLDMIKSEMVDDLKVGEHDTYIACVCVCVFVCVCA